jgi:hypothetical protein
MEGEDGVYASPWLIMKKLPLRLQSKSVEQIAPFPGGDIRRDGNEDEGSE